MGAEGGTERRHREAYVGANRRLQWGTEGC